MVCGKSNEINGEKNCLVFDRREKNCLLLIRSETRKVFKKDRATLYGISKRYGDTKHFNDIFYLKIYIKIISKSR